MAEAREIRQDMQVLGSDGGLVGRVEGVEGNGIKLKGAAGAGPGAHHHVPLTWVARVDDHVHLDREAALVRDSWSSGPSVGGAGSGAAASGRAATDRPAGGSKWLWAVGALLLLLVLFLGVRGCDYASRETNYQDSANGTVDAPGT